MSSVLVIVSDKNAKKHIELAFRSELPRVSCHVIDRTELTGKTVKDSMADMVILEKGHSDIDDSNLIREIRSASKVPIVLMATEREAFYIGPTVADKYEGISETSRKTRLPAWLKQFYKESELKTKVENSS